jgi:hypothetical protein
MGTVLGEWMYRRSNAHTLWGRIIDMWWNDYSAQIDQEMSKGQLECAY